MEFDYSFKNCVLCGREMTRKLNSSTCECENKCSRYLVMTGIGCATVILFNDNNYHYLIKILDNTKDEKALTDPFEIDLSNLLSAIEYWRENDRYLAKLLEGNNGI